jgi:acetamidase/formamidase
VTVAQLRPSPETVHWGHFDAGIEPVGEVASGESIGVRVVTGHPDMPVPPDWLAPELPAIWSAVTDRGPGTHIITGPLHVRGAVAGGVLQIDIQEVELGGPYGFNVLHPLLGLFPDCVDDLALHVVPIDRGSGTAELLPGTRVPVRPFFGILAVAPPPSWGRISSLPPRRHGGNIDLKELRPGASLFLPVAIDGARFSVGDGHAIQGDGEIDCTAVETCLEGRLRLTARDDIELRLPVAVTPTHVITLGFGPSLDEAAREAVAAMLDLLVRECGVARNDAYRLLSMVGDLRITQAVNEQLGAHMMLDLTVVAQLGGRPFFTRPSGH